MDPMIYAIQGPRPGRAIGASSSLELPVQSGESSTSRHNRPEENPS
jgi:hypothetical protein